MISSVNATPASEQEAELVKLRNAKAVAKHRPLVQDLVNDAIDTAVSAGRKIGAYIFEVMRLVGIPSETSGTFNACEAEWRTKHPDAEGKPASKLPVEARSYLNTKSAMLKQWDSAPYYANMVREHAGIIAVRTGQPVADLLAEAEGFLEIDSDRYAGPVAKAVSRWRDDFRTGVAAEKQVKESKAGIPKLGASPGGSGATAQGLGNSGTGGTFPTVVREALNDFVRAINEAENILSVVMLAALIKESATAIRTKTEIYRPKLDTKVAETLAEAIPDADESVHSETETELSDTEAEALDKDLGAQVSQG